MIAADPFMLTFRFLHIVSGVLWVGSVFLFVLFVGPAATEVGPSAGPFLQTLVKRRKVGRVIAGLAGTTVLAGWTMWIRYATQAGLSVWVTSRYGLVLTIGAVSATTAFIFGYFVLGRSVERLVDVGSQVAASRGPPSPEQQATMGGLGRTVRTSGRVVLSLLLLTVAAMSTAQYW